ncbi:ferredoxin [Bordetella pertussis]|nr:ferredoxin [Bordetella pertussis]
MNPAGHEVEVRPQGWRFDARPGESLLRAAAPLPPKPPPSTLLTGARRA